MSRDVDGPLDAKGFMALLLTFYKSYPDDRVISIGHWSETVEPGYPKFYADVRLTVAEIKRMAQQ